MGFSNKLIVCADDFGQNRSISLAICHLVEQQRLNAVSCMVTGPAWKTYCPELMRHQAEIQIGLHLNLTHGQALTHRGFDSLAYLILQAYRVIPISKLWLKTEIRAQIQQFKHDTGMWPQFIDGHQHVHQLPLVREALMECVRELEFKPWFRTTYHFKNRGLKRGGSWKKWLLLCLGGQSFYRLLQRYGYRGNLHFSGDYPFGTAKSYRDIFVSACRALSGEGLIMCHPGLDTEDTDDAIRGSRIHEFQYFSSQAYLDDTCID